MEEKKEKAIDLTKHRFVPKHRLLSSEEAESILERYNISRRQLPYILLRDAMIKDSGAKIGDIIEITRKSETAGESKYYRVVING